MVVGESLASAERHCAAHLPVAWPRLRLWRRGFDRNRARDKCSPSLSLLGHHRRVAIGFNEKECFAVQREPDFRKVFNTVNGRAIEELQGAGYDLGRNDR